MNPYELASLRLLAREHHEQRLRDAESERLARELCRMPQRRPRLRLRIHVAIGDSDRVRAGRLETYADMHQNPQRVLAHLGFDEPTIRRLEARGYLRGLALTEPQIRARLYHGYLAHLHRNAGGQPRKERS